MFKCCNCEKDIEDIADMFYCERCKGIYCAECNQKIHSFPIFKDHKVEKAPKEAYDFRPCPVHGKLMTLYCATCGELCCYKCVVSGEAHSQHLTHTLKVAYEAMAANNAKNCEKLEAILHNNNNNNNNEDENTTENSSDILLDNEIAGLDSARSTELDRTEEAYGRVQDALAEREQNLNEDVAAQEEEAGVALEGLLVDVRDLCINADDILENFGEAAKEAQGLESGIPDMFAVIGMSSEIESTIKNLTTKGIEILEKIPQMAHSLDFLDYDDDNNNNSSDKGKDIIMSSSSDSGSDSDDSSYGDRLSRSRSRRSRSKRKGKKTGTDLSKFKDERSLIEEIKKFGNITKTPNYMSVSDSKLKFSVVSDSNDKSTKTFEFSWGDSISEVFTDFVETSEDVCYVLQMRPTEDAEYTTVYEGRDTSYSHTMTPSADQKPSARLCIAGSGGDSGVPALWQSPEVLLTDCTYMGAFTEARGVKFHDTDHKVVEADKSNSTTTGTVPLTAGVVNTVRLCVMKTDFSNNGVSVGIAPADYKFEYGEDPRNECGWYLNFFNTRLYSGPPQNFSSENYGHRNDIRPGDIITIVANLEGKEGVLSFKINDDDLGVAFDDIPLDKPLVPVVYFYGYDESLGLLGPGEDGKDMFAKYGDADGVNDSDSDRGYSSGSMYTDSDDSGYMT